MWAAAARVFAATCMGACGCNKASALGKDAESMWECCWETVAGNALTEPK